MAWARASVGLVVSTAIALASDMRRYVVERQCYISHTDFVNSIALGLAASGVTDAIAAE